jgi:proteasome lid subunit RPN8/RPN11
MRDSAVEDDISKKQRPILEISANVVAAIIAHARTDYPHMACGMVIGPDGTDRPERLIRMTNASANPLTNWEFDAREQLDIYRKMEKNNEEHVVTYHSHTRSGAYPSKIDVHFADEELTGRHLVIVAIPNPENIELRSHRISASRIMEEEVRIMPSNPETEASPHQ